MNKTAVVCNYNFLLKVLVPIVPSKRVNKLLINPRINSNKIVDLTMKLIPATHPAIHKKWSVGDKI